ncbi:MAG TPA: SDR family oxidoreductase [Propionibacteriaceae bacterium]|nr:SDR family oxidoreductase [Propionibacteriaceae bacterium]
MTTPDPSTRELVVVTGASSGIGRATAEHLASAGFHVLAGVRNDRDAEAVASDHVEAVRLDITDEEQVAALARRVETDPQTRRLRAVVNNAGIAVAAPVEMIPLTHWRRQFEANFFGHVGVIQALLPALLSSRGRVINVSSIGGRVAGPTYGAYSASKFALEAMSDALRREVRHLGVEVVVVQPGAIATPIWEKGIDAARTLQSAMTDEQRRRYDKINAGALQRGRYAAANGVPPDQVAKVITQAITVPRPRTRYLVGRDAKITARLVALLPDRVLDRMIGSR